MHDQSASRISGRTQVAVSAMCVRALRITVLKSAGNFTRDECHDLNAEKIQRVKCFMFTRCGICCVLAIFERRHGRLGTKISGYGQLAKVGVTSPCSVYPREADTNRRGRPVRWVPYSDGGAVLCAEPGLTHLNRDDRTSRRPTCRYRAAKLIRETANNEPTTKS